ncbi:thiamine pyrophosphate-binding protein [Mucilaginibacter paludis]|uniref:Thiamine pyrophosphate TPP-binding domain-containing protein n=1 Tax=Mucilaginibacter paludis DSM 18603 TaxID=714943 RepID=H1XZP0_9SPHI|nr:thiamine pyrophosphate-binding protein [Mucilaginibacter paludis]EHQ27732.1 thiamine pyrophosphate TPP-binding domain-containing protein [Mucilaginibacter paludis DSM 18603]
MKVSDFIAGFLEKKGVGCIFELSGGMITHLLDSISQNTTINIVTMHHEQSAAFAADAYGRVTGLPGVALATSGPGATNLLTGIGSCYFDSSPAIFITGQVNRHEQKRDKTIRQLGFQETDIVAMAKPITKAAYLVNNAEDIPYIFEEAFRIAMEGRPGPVLIDIPMDVQRAQIDTNYISSAVEEQVNIISEKDLKDLISDIQNAQRPLILAGRGVKAAQCQDYFDKFIQKTKTPVITTLLALDTIAFDDPMRVGFIGSYGNRWANIAFGECDLLIVLGSRLDVRQTGADTKFIENRKIYHVDCDSCEINNRIKGCVPIVTTLDVFFKQFDIAAQNTFFNNNTNWLIHINNLKSKWPDTSELNPSGINPNKFMHRLAAISQKAFAYLADVGSHQMWAAQSLQLNKGQLFLTSGGMGAMGFSLPAAIGASITANKKPAVVLIGDGCMQLNIQELQTVVRNDLPIKIIVLNNRTLGMIRQFQDSYFESRYQSTYWGYSAPDFEKIAIAYGINAKTIDHPEEVENAVAWLWEGENENRPLVLQVMIDPQTNTYPKIAFGKPITEMEPFSAPIGMEST